VTELRWALALVAVVLLVAIFGYTRFGARWRAARRVAPASRGSAPAPGTDPPAPPAPRVRPVPLPEKVVTLRLMSREPPGFPGEALVLALREAGLAHGRYGIFHRADAADPEAALFSVASLVEPGSFDLERLRTTTYPGVSLFLTIPGPGDAVAAFDAMVDAGRALAAQLGGELLDEQGSTFSIQRQRYIREEIIQFRHRQARPH
jgi:cell division protein ZipA